MLFSLITTLLLVNMARSIVGMIDMPGEVEGIFMIVFSSISFIMALLFQIRLGYAMATIRWP